VLEVRYTKLEVHPPRNARPRAKKRTVRLSVVQVREVDAPTRQKPLEWMLLCTAAIETLQEALFCVEAYRQRWRVERYHYVLKSGCKIEELQLESAEPIERALALYLQKHRRPPPAEPPRLRDAVRWIAELGGFVGTRSREPGVKVLWRGWRRLQDITHTYRLLQDVGNG
jgi:hypothetical protein